MPRRLCVYLTPVPTALPCALDGLRCRLPVRCATYSRDGTHCPRRCRVPIPARCPTGALPSPLPCPCAPVCAMRCPVGCPAVTVRHALPCRARVRCPALDGCPRRLPCPCPAVRPCAPVSLPCPAGCARAYPCRARAPVTAALDGCPCPIRRAVGCPRRLPYRARDGCPCARAPVPYPLPCPLSYPYPFACPCAPDGCRRCRAPVCNVSHGSSRVPTLPTGADGCRQRRRCRLSARDTGSHANPMPGCRQPVPQYRCACNQPSGWVARTYEVDFVNPAAPLEVANPGQNDQLKNEAISILHQLLNIKLDVLNLKSSRHAPKIHMSHRHSKRCRVKTDAIPFCTSLLKPSWTFSTPVLPAF